MTLASAVRDFCLRHGLQKKYWVAFSGGLDSQVLLSLLAQLRNEFQFELTAIHVNHGLSQHAFAWSEQCHQVCADYGVQYIAADLQINLQTGESLEEQARTLRYQVFAQHMGAGDILVTAHHQDDQAETLLLQLCRGAGIKGLAAMPVLKSFAAGWHGRPLLAFTKTELQEYAQQQQLRWVVDDSNANLAFTRNYLRQQILPLLQAKWPTITATIARSAVHCAEAQRLLDEYAKVLSAEVIGPSAQTVSVQKLKNYTPEQQRLILRYWIQQLGYVLPDANKLHAIQRDVLMAAWDSMPLVVWGNVELRRFRDDLYLAFTQTEHDTTQVFAWDGNEPLTLLGIGTLHMAQTQNGGLRSDITQVTVQFRQGGEMLNVPGRGRLSLKNLFQEWKVLPWLRDRIPLIYFEQKLIGVVGYCWDNDYTTEQGRKITQT